MVPEPHSINEFEAIAKLESCSSLHLAPDKKNQPPQQCKYIHMLLDHEYYRMGKLKFLNDPHARMCRLITLWGRLSWIIWQDIVRSQSNQICPRPCSISGYWLHPGPSPVIGVPPKYCETTNIHQVHSPDSTLKQVDLLQMNPTLTFPLGAGHP